MTITFLDPRLVLNPNIVDEETRVQLKLYANKYVNQLNKKQKRELRRMIRGHDKSYAARVEYRFMYSIHKANLDPLNLVKKAFLFSRYLTIPIFSDHQEVVFGLLEGEELEYYHKQYAARWAGFAGMKYNERFNSSLYGTNQHHSSPDCAISMISNNDFKFDYLKPYLEHHGLPKADKTIMLCLFADKIDEGRENYLTKEQVEYLKGIAAKHKINLSSIASSVKRIHGQEDYPDEWVIALHDLKQKETEYD